MVPAMSAFMLAHPWMTFFLIVFALLVLDSIVVNILKAWRQK